MESWIKWLTVYLLSVIVNIVYSTREAAQVLGLSQDHVRLLARKGVIKAKRLGHDWVVLSLDYKRKRRPKKCKQNTVDQNDT